MPPKAAGSRPAGTNAPLAAAPSTLQIPNAPVDAMPASAGNGVVPWRPAPPARPGTTLALMALFTVFTQALTPATLPDVDETAQLAPLVMPLVLTASSSPPPKTRGLLVRLSDATLVWI